jgi:hypothetical protein
MSSESKTKLHGLSPHANYTDQLSVSQSVGVQNHWSKYDAKYSKYAWWTHI